MMSVTDRSACALQPSSMSCGIWGSSQHFTGLRPTFEVTNLRCHADGNPTKCSFAER